jgi:hypothetical protein
MKARKLILRKEKIFNYVYIPYNWIWKIYDGKHLMYRGGVYQNHWIMDDNFMSTENMIMMGWKSINQEEAEKLYPNLIF